MGEAVRVESLQRRGGLTWSAPVRLPADGTWFAYVTVDGASAPPVGLAVGIPAADGAPPDTPARSNPPSPPTTRTGACSSCGRARGGWTTS